MNENVSGYVDVSVPPTGVRNGFGACRRASLGIPSFSETEPGVVNGISVVVTCPNPNDRGGHERALAMNGGGEPLVDTNEAETPLRFARASACLLAQEVFVDANCGNCSSNPDIAKSK